MLSKTCSTCSLRFAGAVVLLIGYCATQAIGQTKTKALTSDLDNAVTLQETAFVKAKPYYSQLPAMTALLLNDYLNALSDKSEQTAAIISDKILVTPEISRHVASLWSAVVVPTLPLSSEIEIFPLFLRGTLPIDAQKEIVLNTLSPIIPAVHVFLKTIDVAIPAAPVFDGSTHYTYTSRLTKTLPLSPSQIEQLRLLRTRAKVLELATHIEVIKK
jgi:hypothetical protein